MFAHPIFPSGKIDYNQPIDGKAKKMDSTESCASGLVFGEVVKKDRQTNSLKAESVMQCAYLDGC